MIEKIKQFIQAKFVLLSLIGWVATLLAVIISTIVIIISFDKKQPIHTKEIHTNISYVPSPADTVYCQLPNKIDTVTVLREFYSKVTYRDTIFNNDTLKLIVRDTITMNGIASRDVDYTIRIPETKIPRYGIGASFIYGSRQELLLMGEYDYRKMKVYGGYDFGSKTPMIGIGVKLLEW